MEYYSVIERKSICYYMGEPEHIMLSETGKNFLVYDSFHVKYSVKVKRNRSQISNC